MTGVVSLRLETGEVTTATIAVDDQTVVKEVEVLDLGEWLDRVIRSSHRVGRRVRAVVAAPPGYEDDLMGLVAVRTCRRVLGIYDAVKVEWRSGV